MMARCGSGVSSELLRFVLRRWQFFRLLHAFFSPQPLLSWNGRSANRPADSPGPIPRSRGPTMPALLALSSVRMGAFWQLPVAIAERASGTLLPANLYARGYSIRALRI